MARYTSLLAGKRRSFGIASVVCGAVLMLTSGVFANGTVNQIGNEIVGSAANDRLGHSVAMSADGSRIAVGSHLSNSGKGTVRVFEFDGTTWQQLGSDIIGKENNAQSGYSVAISADGSRVAIGAWNHPAAGSARVYELNNGSWQQVGDDIIGEADSDYAGWSVGLSGDGTRIVIGGPGNDANTGDPNDKRGHVRVYQLESGTWQQMGSDINGEIVREEVGYSVAMSSDGTHVIIGAPAITNGRARIYKWNNNSWEKVGSDLVGEGPSDWFGWSVDISANGKFVVVGAPYNDGATSNFGHARVFEWNDSANPPAWRQLGSDIDGDVQSHELGHSVAISSNGTRVVVGGPYKSPDYKGIVRLYEWQSSAWTQVGADVVGGVTEDYFGFSVAISSSGSRAVGGGYGRENNKGFARVFGIIEPPSAPTITSITPTSDGLSVAFTPPTSNGGARITNYEYSLDGGATWTARSPASTTSPLVIGNLVSGTEHSVQLRAVNSIGPSSGSNSVDGSVPATNLTDTGTDSTSTTTAPVVVTQTSSEKSPSEELPASGSNSTDQFIFALLLVAYGWVLVRRSTIE